MHLAVSELKFVNVGFGGERKIGVPGEKPLGKGTRTNNKLNLPGNRSRTTLVGGKSFHHRIIPVPQSYT